MSLLYEWQNLLGAIIGSLTGAIVAYFSSLYFKNQEEKKEIKKSFSQIILILYDIKLIINKYEMYLSCRNDGKISYNKIFINNVNYIESSQVFELHPDFYDSINLIYHAANVVKCNVEKLGDRSYSTGVDFARYYLYNTYKRFNYLVREAKKLDLECPYLKFPDNIKEYTEDYIAQSVERFNLEKYPLEGQ